MLVGLVYKTENSPGIGSARQAIMGGAVVFNSSRRKCGRWATFFALAAAVSWSFYSASPQSKRTLRRVVHISQRPSSSTGFSLPCPFLLFESNLAAFLPMS